MLDVSQYTAVDIVNSEIPPKLAATFCVTHKPSSVNLLTPRRYHRTSAGQDVSYMLSGRKL